MNNLTSSITLVEIVQITLIVLKLTEVINYSWFIVLLPVELSLIIVILVTLFIIWWNRYDD